MSEKTKSNFWNRVVFGYGCWWIKDSNGKGYGQIKLGKRRFLAHRYAYSEYSGIDVSSLHTSDVVMHLCDNPSCVRPDHLRLGTQRDNVRDCIIKNRHNKVTGARHPRATTTDEQVLIIKELLFNSGYSGREIAKIVGVSEAVVTSIKTGRCWNYSINKVTNKKDRQNPRGKGK